MDNCIEGLISIIVPVYNAEGTLERCVASILNQTYKNLEVILIDDASTDGSRNLCMRLEQTDPDRIMVICSDENRGPGGARNLGLSYARGEFIGFVDSDDYLRSSMYEKLVSEMIKGGHDLVDCGYYNETADRAMLNTGREARGKINDAQRNELIVSGGYLWSRLFRRSLLAECGIVFRENCILEDSEILTLILGKAVSVGAVEETLYWYSASPASASKKHSARSYIDNIYGAMNALIGLSDKLENYDALRPSIEYEIIQMYNYGVVMALKDAQSGQTCDTLSELNRLKELRLKGAAPGYANGYVRNKIGTEDIEVMKQNDADPALLIKKVIG